MEQPDVLYRKREEEYEFSISYNNITHRVFITCNSDGIPQMIRALGTYIRLSKIQAYRSGKRGSEVFLYIDGQTVAYDDLSSNDHAWHFETKLDFIFGLAFKAHALACPISKYIAIV